MVATLLLAPTILLGGVALGAEESGMREGEPLRLRVEGVAEGETVTLHSFRLLPKWNGTAYTDVTVHAWAEFRAGRSGIDVDKAKPRRGSYPKGSPLAMLWSAYPVGDPGIPAYARRIEFAPPPKSVGRTFLVLEKEGRTLATGAFRFVGAPGLAFESVDAPGLNGVYAYPKGQRGLPVVINLHGSEGGSIDGARARAAQFAAQGYATLAVNYFAHEWQKIPGVPTVHRDIPVETFERAREWLSQRPEVDMRRVGVWGVSKGAEFAALGASRYPWIKAVVANVPSDAVWEGDKGSSWSVGGVGVPYIPLYPYVEGKYRVNTDRYELSRRDHPVKEAEIPVERSSARFLLLGSDRDEVWASGTMARRLASRLKGRGRAVVFPKAGHQLSGTGTFPPRLYGTPPRDGRDKDLTAEGEAAEKAWRLTLEFLKGL